MARPRDRSRVRSDRRLKARRAARDLSAKAKSERRQSPIARRAGRQPRPREQRGFCAHLGLSQRRSGAAGAATRTHPPLRHRRCSGASLPTRSRRRRRRRCGSWRHRRHRRAARRCESGASGAAAGSRAAGADRYFRITGARPRRRSRPNHRSTQRRRDLTHLSRVRCRRAGDDRAPFARIRRRAREVRLRRPRACADLHRDQSGARDGRTRRSRLLAGRSRFRSAADVAGDAA